MTYTFQKGNVPLLVSFPHSSTFIPEAIAGRMTQQGLSTPDTDWFLPRLYDFLAGYDISIIAAEFSRYVIDPNRSVNGDNLYPGQPTPLLCPLQSFSGDQLYQAGQEPDLSDISHRTKKYWQPYRNQIGEELNRMKRHHGKAVLFDAHSILSRVPRLFEGQLPDISIGTAHGTSCDPSLQQELAVCLQGQSVCSHVINGRFVGGNITRHYGNPGKNIHAIQLELSQRRYMDEDSGEWHDQKAAEIRPILRNVIETIIRWSEN